MKVIMRSVEITLVGFVEGRDVGFLVGEWVGEPVGEEVGESVGVLVGNVVGALVGAGVLHTLLTQSPLMQSVPRRQFKPALHAGHPDAPPPPQSTSVSAPPLALSVQLAPVGAMVGPLVGFHVGFGVGNLVG